MRAKPHTCGTCGGGGQVLHQWEEPDGGVVPNDCDCAGCPTYSQQEERGACPTCDGTGTCPGGEVIKQTMGFPDTHIIRTTYHCSTCGRELTNDEMEDDDE